MQALRVDGLGRDGRVWCNHVCCMLPYDGLLGQNSSSECAMGLVIVQASRVASCLPHVYRQLHTPAPPRLPARLGPTPPQNTPSPSPSALLYS